MVGPLFRSAAPTYGDRVVGLLLTGRSFDSRDTLFMSTRQWWILIAVLIGALISGVLLSRVYVRQQVPPGEIEQFAPKLRIGSQPPERRWRVRSTLARALGLSPNKC